MIMKRIFNHFRKKVFSSSEMTNENVSSSTDLTISAFNGTCRDTINQ